MQQQKSAKKSELTAAGLIRILKEATEYCAESGMEISFTSPGQVPESILRDMNLEVPCCGACISNMAIAPNGNVVPCQSWLGKTHLWAIFYLLSGMKFGTLERPKR